MVDVVCCCEGRMLRFNVQLKPGDTLGAVIERSGVADLCGLSLEAIVAGVFGQLRPLDASIRAGERVEIYRPLICDPKSARRERAVKRRLQRLRDDVRPG